MMSDNEALMDERLYSAKLCAEINAHKLVAKQYLAQWYEAQLLLERCLDTGALRCDTHRQLYEDVCRFLGVEPK